MDRWFCSEDDAGIKMDQTIFFAMLTLMSHKVSNFFLDIYIISHKFVYVPHFYYLFYEEIEDDCLCVFDMFVDECIRADRLIPLVWRFCSRSWW
jgi:hypothetical protein